jgi:acyl carrier protein
MESNASSIPTAPIAPITAELYDTQQILEAICVQQQRPRPQLDTPFLAPRTPTEKTLAAILQSLLRVEQIGVNDNFFQIGGHSLLATQFVARVQEAFQVEVPLPVLFEGSPSVASLAEAIEHYQIEQASPDEVATYMRELEGLSDAEIEALIAAEVV